MTYSMRMRQGLVAVSVLALTACGDFDFDLRGQSGAFSTADAVRGARTERPAADDRGIISYPNYQVVVAQRDDTVTTVAARLGLDADELGRFNGLPADTPLRQGELLALPSRVAEPSAETGAPTVDVATLAGTAIDQTDDTETVAEAPAPKPVAPTPEEPTRHKVVRGETAYSISRLYNVTVRNLARWNGLDAQFTVREGQFLLIPVGGQEPPAQAAETVPGQGSPTPTPPSAAKPLPRDTTPSAASQKPPETKTDLGQQTKPEPSGVFAYPVDGTIIREYAKGRNDGIDIKGSAGGNVKAADAGTVAAITQSSDGVPIIVVRHANNLLTVYANVTDVQVARGEAVTRGQGLAKLRDGDQSFVHFEVRDGFDSVDPNRYLN